ncbi:MAG: PQQ-dependent sugar dehydrogenase [Chthoniobacterales bacterium]
MNFLFRFGFVFLLGAGCALPKVFGAKADEIYRQHCASCHGENLEGGLGSSLIDGAFKHGTSDQDIQKNIASGLPDLDMPPFANVLSRQDQRALVIFIREKETAYKNQKNPFPRLDKSQKIVTDRASYRVEEVVNGLATPWALDFLPDGRMIVTERGGAVRFVNKDGSLEAPIKNIPQSVQHGQGGMLAVTLHPDYEKNGWVYLGFADGLRKSGSLRVLTKIVRGKIENNTWKNEEVIWQGKPSAYGERGVHFGTRIVIRDGYLWFGIGDRGEQQKAQDLSLPNGSIFRLHDDGSIPRDNPFVNVRDALPEIWSYGHRNPQGLVFDEMTGGLYETEHGPRGGDEFNRIERGKNYGWPVITYGMNYNGTPITDKTEQVGMEQPLSYWTPSIATCGLDVASGKAFPNWKNDFFAGGLASKELHRLRVRDGEVIERELISKGLGRIRDVRIGPDGLLYLVLNAPDKIVRFVPVD